MAQRPSNVYTKTATYDFTVGGAITPGIANGINMGIVLNPGEFVISAWYKVTTAFASAAPAADSWAVIFNTDLFTPLYDILITTTNGLNATLGSWANARQITTFGQVVRQTATPPGTPSNNFLYIYGAGNTNTAGAIAVCCLVGSTPF